MLNVSNLSLHFGDRALFDEISFQLKPKEKIGLVGRNGAGKSTLLKAIAGVIKTDGGNVSKPNDYTIGFLTQDLQEFGGNTVIEEARKAFDRLVAIEEELDKLRHEVETRTDYESDSYMKLLHDFGEKDALFHHLDGTKVEEKIEKVLKGLGFSAVDMQKRMPELSGGWQMRVELAKILLSNPDLMLLDEPTNHLDIESIIWLEQFLKDYSGSVILISHDKVFLDEVTNRTIEISYGNIEDYKAPYSKYLDMRAERKELQTNAKKNQDRQIKQIERNIERFRAKASKAKFAQSLIKKLDKIEEIEIDDEDVRVMKLRFPESMASGKVVLELNKVQKSYGEKEVIKDASFYVNRGDRIAFVGKNGMGKTTLARIIAGNLNYKGTLKIGHNVQLGYYAQHQADVLEGDLTVFQSVDNEAVGDMRLQVRNLLGCFLFSGEDVNKKVKVLSGGEKSRLALAKLLLQPINLLILDEPTNHLDILSKQQLKQALLEYKGTMIVVSHDRDFLYGLTNRVFEFREDGVKEYPGDINAFLEEKKVDSFRAFELSEDEKPEKVASKTVVIEEKPTVDSKELKKLKNRFSKIEAEISDIERNIQRTEEKLKDGEFFNQVANDASFFENYEKLKNELSSKMSEWEALGMQLEEMEEGS